MNFLSHHFADAIENEHYYNLGLVLPDMMGTVQRRWRLPSSFALHEDDVFTERIAEGTSRHLNVDAYFHSSAFFKEFTAIIREVFKKNKLDLPGVRLFFVAHIFLELMLDRLIILNYSAASPNFYFDLSKIENELLKPFFKLAGVENVTKFMDFFERFQTLKYLNHYIEDESLLYALNRIMQRAGQPVFGEEVKQNFFDTTLETQEKLSKEYLKIFEELKTQK